MDKCLSINQVADILGVDRTTIERLIYRGEMSAFKISPKKRSPVRIRVSDLNKFIERNKVA
jgi:excisionase family DNA binding protein